MIERDGPHVAVVLLNYCGESDTAACVRSLLSSEYPELRIILVDNGSPDGSGERLRQSFPEVEFIQTGCNLGFTGGNKIGMERALAQGSDYVLFLNNDTVVEPACISRLVEAAEGSARAGAVGAKILYHDAPDRVWFGGGDFSRLRLAGAHRGEGALDTRPEGGAIESVTFLTGCCLMMPSAVLRELGGFREDFFAYLEDVELSHRLSSAGYRLLYQPAARVYHRVPLKTPAIAPWKIVLRDRNRRRIARDHLNRVEALQFALFFYPSRFLRVAGYLLQGDRQRAAAVLRGMVER